MDTTKLSSKGQVIIPKAIRNSHHWEAGLELNVIDTEDGVLLKPRTPFAESNIEDVSACLKYNGEKKTLADMEAAIQQGIRDTHK